MITKEERSLYEFINSINDQYTASLAKELLNFSVELPNWKIFLEKTFLDFDEFVMKHHEIVVDSRNVFDNHGGFDDIEKLRHKIESFRNHIESIIFEVAKSNTEETIFFFCLKDWAGSMFNQNHDKYGYLSQFQNYFDFLYLNNLRSSRLIPKKRIEESIYPEAITWVLIENKSYIEPEIDENTDQKPLSGRNIGAFCRLYVKAGLIDSESFSNSATLCQEICEIVNLPYTNSGKESNPIRSAFNTDKLEENKFQLNQVEYWIVKKKLTEPTKKKIELEIEKIRKKLGFK